MRDHSLQNDPVSETDIRQTGSENGFHYLLFSKTNGCRRESLSGIMTAIMIAAALNIGSVSAGTQDLLSRGSPADAADTRCNHSLFPVFKRSARTPIRITAMQIPGGVPYSTAVFEKRQAGNKKSHSSAVTEECTGAFFRDMKRPMRKSSPCRGSLIFNLSPFGQAFSISGRCLRNGAR